MVNNSSFTAKCNDCLQILKALAFYTRVGNIVRFVFHWSIWVAIITAVEDSCTSAKGYPIKIQEIIRKMSAINYNLQWIPNQSARGNSGIQVSQTFVCSDSSSLLPHRSNWPGGGSLCPRSEFSILQRCNSWLTQTAI